MTEQSPHRTERQSADRRFLRTASEILALGVVAFNWIATQAAAARMGYPPFLDGRIIAHIYQPLGWLWWEHKWPENGLRIGNRIVWLAPIWRSCERLVIYPMLVLGGVAALCALFLMKPRQAADLHGSATWADAAEIEKAGLL